MVTGGSPTVCTIELSEYEESAVKKWSKIVTTLSEKRRAAVISLGPMPGEAELKLYLVPCSQFVDNAITGALRRAAGPATLPSPSAGIGLWGVLTVEPGSTTMV